MKQKKLKFTALVLLLLAFLAVGIGYFIMPDGSIRASSPFDNASSNPNVVAYYTDGPHGIPGHEGLHTGTDIVIKDGDKFQQWFYGISPEEGLHGHYTIWQESDNGTCETGLDTVENAYTHWGNYFKPGVTYCAYTTDFNPNTN